MCGVYLRDKVQSVELRRKMRIELVTGVVKRNQLRSLGYVLQKDDGDWVR